MSKWYGNLINRVDEGNQYVPQIEVGTPLTEYMWSDRHAYEVVEVQDQEHIKIRQYKAVRIDDNGMSDCQNYKYEHDEKSPVIELEKRRGCWYKVRRYLKSEIMADVEKRFADKTNDTKNIDTEFKWAMFNCGFTEGQWAKFNEGKEIKKYTKWNNISFGVADEYYDYSF